MNRPRTRLAAAAALVVLLWPAPASAQHVVLVRHAEKAVDGTDDPPLTPEGEARAEALSHMVAFADLDAILSTPFVRCLETAAPSSVSSGAAVVEIGVDGGMDAHISRIADAIHAYSADERILVVGHSNTIPLIIAALGGPALDQIDDEVYDRLFFMDLSKADVGFGEASFGAASP